MDLAWNDEQVSYPHPSPIRAAPLILKIRFPQVSFTGAILPNAIAPVCIIITSDIATVRAIYLC